MKNRACYHCMNIHAKSQPTMLNNKLAGRALRKIFYISTFFVVVSLFFHSLWEVHEVLEKTNDIADRVASLAETGYRLVDGSPYLLEARILSMLETDESFCFVRLEGPDLSLILLDRRDEHSAMHDTILSSLAFWLPEQLTRKLDVYSKGETNITLTVHRPYVLGYILSHTFQQVGGYAVIFALFSVLLYLSLNHYISRPIISLSNDLKGIQGFEKPIRIPIPKGHETSEIGSLTHSINRLLESVHTSMQKHEADEKIIKENLKRMDAVYNSIQTGIVVMNPKTGLVVDANPRAMQMVGVSKEEFIGSHCDQFICPDGCDAIPNSDFPMASVDVERRIRAKDGSMIPVLKKTSQVIIDDKPHALVTFLDITEIKAAEKKLLHQATHDALTGLPNRTLFLDRLRYTLESSKRDPEHKFAVLLIDLDMFKRINDAHGHHTGDKLLVDLSEKLKQSIDKMDFICRLGGDEFAVLLDSIAKPSEIIRSTRRIQDVFSQDYDVDGLTLDVGASIGIVMHMEHYDNAEDILRDADISMYKAKEMGKNCFKIFSASMHEEVLFTMEMENDLKKAIAEKSLDVHYQPIVDAYHSEPVKLEALARWYNSSRGAVSPGVFIPLAEESGLIHDVGRLVLDGVCAELAEWLEEFGPDGTPVVSVNLSAKEFSSSGILEKINSIVDMHNVPAEKLLFEITESTIMEDSERALSVMKNLKDEGFALAIDDFGTGYSSLGYLQKFPVDTLKIDMQFIDGVEWDKEKQAIVQAIVNLAGSLDINTVAEGVENEAQLGFLSSVGCNYIQGFYISEPLSSLATTEYLRVNGAFTDVRKLLSFDLPAQTNSPIAFDDDMGWDGR